jgi:hypothetical protein
MPEKKHIRGVGQKEQRQYEHIKESAQKEGRYGKAGQGGRRPYRDEGAAQEGEIAAPGETIRSGTGRRISWARGSGT